MRKALASNPIKSGRLGFIGNQVPPKDSKTSVVPVASDESVIPYERVTLLMRPELADWLRRRKYWERIDMTEDVEHALELLRQKVGKEYEPVPPKKRRRA